MRSIAQYTRNLYERQVTSQPFRLEVGEQRDRDLLSRRPSPVRDASDSLRVRIRSVPQDSAAKSRFLARDGFPQRIGLPDSARPAADSRRVW